MFSNALSVEHILPIFKKNIYYLCSDYEEYDQIKKLVCVFREFL